MNTKFTPGPLRVDRGNDPLTDYGWTADHEFARHQEYFRIVDGSGTVVAMAVYASDNYEPSEENAANAALIAAAPSLYEALDMLMLYFTSANDVPVDRATIRGDDECVRRAFDALKKARGEE